MLEAGLLGMLVKHILVFIFLFNISLGYAGPQTMAWFTHDDKNHVSINVDLFLSSTCPHCQKADAFFRGIEQKEPWLVIHRYVINQDKAGLQRFYEHLQQQHSSDFSVPAIFFCNTRWAGFADQQTTGKALLRALSYCHQKIIQQGGLSPETTTVLQKWGSASQVQIRDAISASAVSFIPITALSDALSPCSLSLLAAFLAFMWLFSSRKWQQFSIGVVFIVGLALVHYLQQAHVAFYYQTVFKWRLAAVLAGLFLLFGLFRDYRKKDEHIDINASPWFLATMFTVCAVYIYQQTCVFNLALVFAQWLTEQSISPAVRVSYQMIYQLFYVLPLVLLLVCFLVFGRCNWIMRHQQLLKTAAYLILAGIGIILLSFPLLLSNLWVSAIVLFGAIAAGWVRRRYEQVN